MSSARPQTGAATGVRVGERHRTHSRTCRASPQPLRACVLYNEILSSVVDRCLRELFQQRLGVLRALGVEAFGEPVVDGGEEGAGTIRGAGRPDSKARAHRKVSLRCARAVRSALAASKCQRFGRPFTEATEAPNPEAAGEGPKSPTQSTPRSLSPEPDNLGRSPAPLQLQ